jgi:hypothetical protein
MFVSDVKRNLGLGRRWKPSIVLHACMLTANLKCINNKSLFFLSLQCFILKI